MTFFPRRTYLDHNATTPLAPEVRRVIGAVLKRDFGNASSLHTPGREARGIIDQARKSVALLLGCAPERIFFTSGGTEANNTIIKGVFEAAGGGHLVTSKIEHESVLAACAWVESRGGKVSYLPAGTDGLVRNEDLRAALRPETILISIMHANNETGAIQPVREIAALARAAGVAWHSDAVQTFGKIPTLVDDLGCEFLSLSAHKINGPKGIGAFYWRGNTPWSPLLAGGSQERSRRGGTEGVHQVAGLGAACRLAAARMKSGQATMTRLRRRLLGGLLKIYPGVRINEAPREAQLPGTVSATFPGKDGLRLMAGLDCCKVSVSIGSACTADSVEPSHVILGMGRSREDALSTIRISLGPTTTERDIHWCLEALEMVLRKDPPGLAYLDPQHLTAARILAKTSFIVDLRFPYERMLSPSIPGARLWSHIGFEKIYMRHCPRDKEVILICHTGIFSLGVGYRLARAGYPDVKVVYGGYSAWWATYPGLIDKLKTMNPR